MTASRRNNQNNKQPEYDALLEDYEFFEANRAEWASQGHLDEYALVRDNHADFYPTLKEAYEVGLSRFGPTSYFIRRVTKEREIHYLPFLLEEDLIGHA